MRFTKDDIVLLILGVFFAISIVSPIVLISNINKDKIESLNKAALQKEERRINELKKQEELDEQKRKKEKELEEIKKAQIEKEKKEEEERKKEEEERKKREAEKEKEENAKMSSLTSVGKFFFKNSLNEAEQKAYNVIYSKILAFEENYFAIPNVPVASLLKIHDYILSDNEEIFYVTALRYITNSSKYCTKVKLEYNCNKSTKVKNQKEIETIADSIVKKVKGKSKYEKTKYIHDYIIKNTQYVLNSTDNQNIASVFLYKKSVCAGYAKAFQYLLRKAGVYCIYITGDAINILDQNNPNAVTRHAWNLVKLDDGKYYYVDTTFDDPIFTNNTKKDFCSYAHLNITTKELLLNHKINKDLREEYEKAVACLREKNREDEECYYICKCRECCKCRGDH